MERGGGIREEDKQLYTILGCLIAVVIMLSVLAVILADCICKCRLRESLKLMPTSIVKGVKEKTTILTTETVTTEANDINRIK